MSAGVIEREMPVRTSRTRPPESDGNPQRIQMPDLIH
jgi:hypothetical protein